MAGWCIWQVGADGRLVQMATIEQKSIKNSMTNQHKYIIHDLLTYRHLTAN